MLTLLPEMPPVSDALLTTGGSHVYIVLIGTIPFTLSVGLKVNCTPLHVTEDIELI